MYARGLENFTGGSGCINCTRAKRNILERGSTWPAANVHQESRNLTAPRFSIWMSPFTLVWQWLPPYSMMHDKDRSITKKYIISSPDGSILIFFFVLFFFFLCWRRGASGGWGYCPSRFFHSFWAESIVRLRRKREIPEKNHLTTCRQNLACLTCDPS